MSDLINWNTWDCYTQIKLYMDQISKKQNKVCVSKSYEFDGSKMCGIIYPTERDENGYQIKIERRFVDKDGCVLEKGDGYLNTHYVSDGDDDDDVEQLRQAIDTFFGNGGKESDVESFIRGIEISETTQKITQTPRLEDAWAQAPSKEEKNISSSNDLSNTKVDDTNSKRNLRVWGFGYDMGTCEFDFINTHDEDTGEELDEPEYEPAEGTDEIDDSYVCYPPTLYLENKDTGEQMIIDTTEKFKELGIEVDENLTYEVKEDSKSNDQNEIDSSKEQEYYLIWEQGNKGTWGELRFTKGEVLDFKKIKIQWERDSYLGEKTCSVWYGDKEINEGHCTEGKSIDTYLEKH